MKQLDLRHYHCPVPLLMTKNALEKLAKGHYLEIQFGHTSAVKDFEILCHEMQCRIISCEKYTTPNGQIEYKMNISN
ncbi:sulfurtransferase TusA family protein [uncultured Actinobacillus sp.]|uniref:sulfurtransferase TusA family protein n=1 Tax=uncultured Actinobacillus sp. TaxID=417616 RepID=UPI0025DFBB3C|nr:sulfurtransferase TusA family protein [uncultured Actinobacillus sp.]